MKWDLWLRAPKSPYPERFSRYEIARWPWVENIPYDEFSRLMRIFMEFGKACKRDRDDLPPIPCEKPIRRGESKGGFYVLVEPESEADGAATRYIRIDSVQGREAVEAWIDVNYRVLRPPVQARAQDRMLIQVGEKECLAWILETWTAVTGFQENPERMEYMANLPQEEYERLRRIFRQYGTPMTAAAFEGLRGDRPVREMR
ncbi:MAG: hypothetical protein NT049_01750 [Planctomycetota bacterium]|nr:hypothetical protein [Planctomycetota bacterium]